MGSPVPAHEPPTGPVRTEVERRCAIASSLNRQPRDAKKNARLFFLGACGKRFRRDFAVVDDFVRRTRPTIFAARPEKSEASLRRARARRLTASLLPFDFSFDDTFRPASRHDFPFDTSLKNKLVEESELKWDCGDAYPEPALDEVPAKIVGRNEAGLMLGGALVVMAGVYNFAKWVDTPATQPFADKTFPFDGLKAELGGE